MFIESKNSEFVFVCFSLLKRNSIASVVPIGFNILLKTKTFVSSVLSTNNSSFLVPDFNKSMVGKTLLSATFLSNTYSEFPVPLNSSKITSSILLPVSMRAVAIIVSEPPSSMFLAAPKNLFGL